MRHKLFVLLLAIALLSAIPPLVVFGADANSLVQVRPLFGLPWASDPEQAGPRLHVDLNTQTIQGPSAVALGAHERVFLLDNQANRLLGFDSAGRPYQQIQLPEGKWIGLAVGPDQGFALLDSQSREVALLDRNGQFLWRLPVSPLVGSVVRIGYAPDGSLQVENQQGERFNVQLRNAASAPLVPADFRQRGPIGSEFECGLRVVQGLVQLYRWQTVPGTADARDEQPQVIGLNVGPVSGARLLSGCSERGMLIELQPIEAGKADRPVREVVFARAGEILGRWRLDGENLYEPEAPVDFSGRAVVMIRPMPAGLRVLRWTLP